MKVLLQRVTYAKVVVEGRTVGEIDRGLLLLVGFGKDDHVGKLKPMASKVVNLRIFENEERKFDRSLMDVAGEVLVVSQFTLYGMTEKGRRPDFFEALDPSLAKELYIEFIEEFKSLGISRVESGEFGAEMFVSLENHGPVTMLIES